MRERDSLMAKIKPDRSLLDRPLKPVAGLVNGSGFAGDFVF